MDCRTVQIRHGILLAVGLLLNSILKNAFLQKLLYCLSRDLKPLIVGRSLLLSLRVDQATEVRWFATTAIYERLLQLAQIVVDLASRQLLADVG